MTPNHKHFEEAQRQAAEQALTGVSDTGRVEFALGVLTAVSDPAAAGTLAHAAKRAGEHANILIREAFEMECA